MPEARAFVYTVLRLVPRVERGECVNVGVVLFCRELAFLGGRTELSARRMRALWPDLDVEAVRPHLEAICAVIAGRPEAGPLAALPPSERFGWAAAPASTIIQPAPIHTGLTADPRATLERLFADLVLTPGPRGGSTIP